MSFLRVVNRLAEQTKYFICRQYQDPEHQTGHYLRCPAYSYRPGTELIFQSRINSFDRSPLLKPLRFVRSKFSLLATFPIVIVNDRLMTK